MKKKRVNWLKKMLTIMAWSTFIVVVTVAVLGGSYTMWRLNNDQPVVFESEAEHFKYGSTGGERLSGIPYAMWKVLPRVFEDKLPQGKYDAEKPYAPFGFIYEDGVDLPIGVSVRRARFSRLTKSEARRPVISMLSSNIRPLMA